MKPTTFLSLRRVAKKLSFWGHIPIAQKILRRIFYGAQGTVHIHDFDGDLTIELRLSEHMQSRIFWIGYYSREVIAVIDRLARKDMIFIDVGANIGEITMVAAKRVTPSGQVISFEPADRHAELLERNVLENNLSNVTVVRCGLSDYEGTAQMYDSCGQGVSNDEHLGLSSVYRGTGLGPPIQSVTLTTLDGFLDLHPLSRVDIIKIDIEGAELPCLRGAERTLRRFAPHLIVEIQRTSAVAAGYKQSDILDFLSQFGYTFFSIGHGGKLRPVDATNLGDYQNVLCVPSNAFGSSRA